MSCIDTSTVRFQLTLYPCDRLHATVRRRPCVCLRVSALLLLCSARSLCVSGDEMTRIIWKLIKEQLIFPFVDVPVSNELVQKRGGDSVVAAAWRRCCTVDLAHGLRSPLSFRPLLCFPSNCVFLCVFLDPLLRSVDGEPRCHQGSGSNSSSCRAEKRGSSASGTGPGGFCT